MLRHANTLDEANAAREVVADVAKNTKPAAMPVDKGPMQQLAARVIGGKGDKPEALWKTIQSYTKPGGDVGALAGLVRQLPEDMKGDIAGAVVRGLGKNQSGGFSLDSSTDCAGLQGKDKRRRPRRYCLVMPGII